MAQNTARNTARALTGLIVAGAVILPTAPAIAAPPPRPPDHQRPTPPPPPPPAPAPRDEPAPVLDLTLPGDVPNVSNQDRRPGGRLVGDSSPTNLSLRQTDSGIEVSFIPPGPDACPGIIDYELTVNGGAWTPVHSTQSPVSIPVPVNAERVSVRLRAVSDDGRCAPSAQVEIRLRSTSRIDDGVNANAFYSIDGSGNNAGNASWGAAGIELVRKAAAGYADGISAPAGAARPSAREISNALSEQLSALENDRGLSDFMYVWGQFLDHDIDLSASARTEALPITVPTGDTWFDPAGLGTKVIPFGRSVWSSSTGTSTSNPRQQVNAVTAFVDGSQVYGSDAGRANALRTFSGGQLSVSDGNMMPFNTAGLANANDSHVMADSQLYVAGDVRANENPDLVSLHTLFLREHNRIASGLASAHPDWSDEQLYQAARQRVIAELQAITYNEFLPALLGRPAIRQYTGYHADVNPSIANEFSTGAFRFGHSLLDSEIAPLNDNGSAAGEPISLAQALFNTSVFDPTAPNHTGDIDPFLKGAAVGVAQEVDLKVVDQLRNMLFGAPGEGGLDLVALNIQRGRDHGLADYNSTRAAYGLAKVSSFAEISPDPQVQHKLADLYGSVDDIDLWVGGLAEHHAPGASVGPLFQRIIADQFTRLRDGDRNWYQSIFTGDQLRELDRTRLSDVIRRNTALKTLQSNVFMTRS